MAELNDMQKWAVGEYFGNAYEQEVTGVHVMSPLSEGEPDRIYVRFAPNKAVVVTEQNVEAALRWWNSLDEQATDWYRPMRADGAANCMWCGRLFPRSEVDEHEQHCG